MLPLLVLAIISSSEICFGSTLHELMTEPEFAYYFNSKADSKLLPDYEIVYLPAALPQREAANDADEQAELNYKITAFGRPINLKLKANENLLSSSFQSFVTSEDETASALGSPSKNCHFIHKDPKIVASISTCDGSSIHGLLFLENSTLEVSPLTERLQQIAKLREPILEECDFPTVPHIVKRATFASGDFHRDYFPIAGNVFAENLAAFKHKRGFRIDGQEEFAESRVAPSLTLEVALFFDEAAYRIFAPYMSYDDIKLQDMILAYLNGVQALYHHPSLGTSLDIVLVRLDIMKKQPRDMPHYEGERSQLLDSFCDYQSRNNPDEDENPNHWDMALYISGLDFFAYENGRKSGVTMGLATVGGVCLKQYNCIIAELGTTNIFGKPYPSAGFTSVYILAHEIGHNLGMHHDNSGNGCSKEGFIMSPSRGTNGETQWSSCSADVMAKLDWAKCLQDSATPPHVSLDHSRFLDNPGQVYTAKKQCEILLTDRDAVVSPNQKLDTICYNLQCKTPHKSGFYFAGPALDGTQCGNGRYCYGGDCIKKSLSAPASEVAGGWGPWKTESCSSACLERSLGFQPKRRVCNKPIPVNTDKGCAGFSYEISLCKDNKICGSRKRKAVTQFASEKCKEFSKLLPELDPKGVGLQAPHEELRLWMGCAIFCKRGDSGSFYTPRLELNDMGVSPYFPDGTWCHRDKVENYYCVQHHCLPESFQLTKTSVLNGLGEDVPLSQNAHPNKYISPGLQSYLSLGSDGKPMKTYLKPGDAQQPNDEDWETKDYLELPQNV